MAECIADVDCSLEMAKDRLLAEMAKGITPTIRVDREDGPALEGFLSQHNGVKAFLWTPPYGYRQIKVVCRKWSVKAGLLKTTFTATFEQVIS